MMVHVEKRRWMPSPARLLPSLPIAWLAQSQADERRECEPRSWSTPVFSAASSSCRLGSAASWSGNRKGSQVEELRGHDHRHVRKCLSFANTVVPPCWTGGACAPSRPDSTQCTRMRIFRVRALWSVSPLYDGFSTSWSAGPYAGQAMGQRERTPSGHTGSLSLMDGKEMLQATSSSSLNE